jgi:hypothetical protein
MPAPGPREGPLSQADLDRAMEDLARRLENGDVPGGVLKDLGMDREQLQEFVARYREARRRDEAETGAGTAEKGHVVESPAAAAEDVRAADGLPDKLPKDALRARFEDASDHLAARYRDVVQQYYKTLSEAP